MPQLRSQTIPINVPGDDPPGGAVVFPTETYDPKPAPVIPVTAKGGGGGGGGGGFGDLSGKPQFNFGPVPKFTYDPFNAPTQADAQNEPGYQFRLKSGSDALERSAAAKGVLRTGGTLKDITEYGQNFGAQEYNNVFNRALSAYDRKYQGQKDAFAPSLLQYQLQGQAETQAALAQYNRQFDLYTFNNRNSGQQRPIPPPPDAPDVNSFNRGELWPEYA